MCIMSTPSYTAPAVAEPPAPTKEADTAVQQSRSEERMRARNAAGAASTVATSPMGVAAPATTAQKKLIGQ